MSLANEADPPCVAGFTLSEGEPLDNNTAFRDIMGCLQYAATQTRPDMCLIVNRLSQKLMCPTQGDWKLAKRCLRYLKGTANLGVCYRPGSTELVAFSDADFAGDQTRKSTTGYIVKYAGGPITWRSKVQNHHTTSTSEAELLAVSDVTKELTYLKRIKYQLDRKTSIPAPIFCDFLGTTQILNGDASTQRTRHIGAHLGYTKQQIEKKVIEVKHIPGNQ